MSATEQAIDDRPPVTESSGGPAPPGGDGDVGNWWNRLRHPRNAGLVGLGTVLILVAAMVVAIRGGGGSDADEVPPEVQGGWERTEAWVNRDIFDYDNVATSSTPTAVAWFTRRDSGDREALAYWEIRQGRAPTKIEVPTPADEAVIPVAVASQGGRWASVAVTRDAPQGPNTGLMVWTGHSAGVDATESTESTASTDRDVAEGHRLRPPPRLADPVQSVSAAVLDGGVVVAALADGRPVLWSRSAQAAEGSNQSWQSSSPRLGLDDELTSVKVASDGERMILAGVDTEGQARLWSVRDALSAVRNGWEPISADLPDDAGAVDVLVPLADGRLVVAWLEDENSAPFNATGTTVQRLQGDDLLDEGRIKAEDSQVSGIAARRVDLAGATLSPEDRLVVTGAALRSNGTASPMVWVRDRGSWHPSPQAELVNRLDHQLRSIVSAPDDTMVAVVVSLSHIDVEAWRWHP